jgi:uncharacterized protein DUF4388
VTESELCGRIRDFPVREMLFLICLSRRTGTLLLRDGGTQGRVDFFNGTIVRATVSSGFSNVGNLLMRSGAVTEAQLEQALRLQRAQGTRVPIGRVLIRLGCASEPQVRSALREQVEEVTQALLGLKDGEYQLVATIALPEDEFVQDIPDVLLAANLNIHTLLQADRVLLPEARGEAGSA